MQKVYPKGIISFLYNVRHDTAVREQFHRNSTATLMDFGLPADAIASVTAAADDLTADEAARGVHLEALLQAIRMELAGGELELPW